MSKESVAQKAKRRRPRRTEAADHEALLRIIVDQLPAAVAISQGPELRLMLVNPEYQALAPGKPMLGRTMEEVWPELDPEVFGVFRRVLDTGEPYRAVDSDYRIRRSPEGPLEQAWFTWSLCRVRLPGNSGWALLNTAWETTEHKKSQELLHDNESQLRTFVNSLPQLCWIAHADGHIFWYNDRWYEYTGTNFEQMQGWGWKAVHDPAVLPTVVERWQASIKSGRPFEMVFPLRGKDGKFRSFLTRIVPVHNAAGELIRWFGTNTDIEELKRAQDAVRESEAKLRLQQERLRLARTAAKIASWEYDPEAEEFDWSSDVYEMFEGVRLGLTLREFLSLMRYSADRENAARALKNASARGHDCEFVFRILAPDGHVRLIMARGRRFYNRGETIVLGMFIDTTPQGEKMEPKRTKPKFRGQKHFGGR